MLGIMYRTGHYVRDNVRNGGQYVRDNVIIGKISPDRANRTHSAYYTATRQNEGRKICSCVISTKDRETTTQKLMEIMINKISPSIEQDCERLQCLVSVYSRQNVSNLFYYDNASSLHQTLFNI